MFLNKFLKRFSLLILMAVLCLGASMTTKAATVGSSKGTKSYTTTDNVNYRTGAGLSKKVKGTLKKGTTVRVEKNYSKKKDGYTWYRFKKSGKNYYVASKYLKKKSSSSSSSSSSSGTTSYVTTSSLNYRSGPGKSYKVKGTLKKGATVKVEKGYSKKVNGTKWYRFKKNGKKYYVSSKYLKKKSSSSSSSSSSSGTTSYVTTSALNYRSGPGLSNAKKGTLQKGETVKVENGYSKKADGYTWVRFKKNSKKYYVAKKYLTKKSSSSSSSSASSSSSSSSGTCKYRSSTISTYLKNVGSSSGTSTSAAALAAGAVKESGTTSRGVLTKSKGVVYFHGHTETYYSQKVLPGHGLKIPGRHVEADDGTIRDENDFICVANVDYKQGTIIETSLGLAKVYDTGCASGTVDVYTDW